MRFLTFAIGARGCYAGLVRTTHARARKAILMPKFIVCPECAGTGTSSAYLGSFTSDEWNEQDSDFREDYVAGRYDRACDECKGQRVVAGCKVNGCSEPVAVVNGFFGRTVGTGCFDHDEDAQSAAEVEAMSAAERAFGC